MTRERLKELETSLARAYSISGDPELVDVNEHTRCYEDIQKLIEREIERQSVTDEEIKEAIEWTNVLFLYEKNSLRQFREHKALFVEKYSRAIDRSRKLITEILKEYQVSRNPEQLEKVEQLGCECKQTVLLNGTAYCADCRRKL